MSASHSDKIQDNLGRLLMVGFHGPEPDRHLGRMIDDFGVGGVILFRRNIEDQDQLRKLTGEIQEIARDAGYSEPLLIAIDQEGGMVNRITGGVALSPGNMALGALRDRESAYSVGKIIGTELAELGINMNFAPVLDLVRDPENHLGTRCFGEDPELAGQLGSQYAWGLADSGVIPVGKHFLGYDGSTTDPHLELPVNPLPRGDLESSLEPFKIARDQVGGIMSAHIVLEAYDDHPVTLSGTVIKDLLRERIGFTGPVVTDCLEMGAIERKYGTGEAAVKAVKAGNDLLIVSHQEEKQVEALEALKEALAGGQLSRGRIKRGLGRLSTVKPDFDEGPRPRFSLEDDKNALARYAGKAITPVKQTKLPISPEEDLLLVVPQISGRSLSEVQDEETTVVSPGDYLKSMGYSPDEIIYDSSLANSEKILESSEDRDRVVILVLDPEDVPRKLLGELAQLPPRVLLVGVEKPWGLEELPNEELLLTYGHTESSLRGLALVLAGEVIPEGVSPVEL